MIQEVVRRRAVSFAPNIVGALSLMRLDRCQGICIPSNEQPVLARDERIIPCLSTPTYSIRAPTLLSTYVCNAPAIVELAIPVHAIYNVICHAKCRIPDRLTR